MHHCTTEGGRNCCLNNGRILLANSNQWYFNKLVKKPCHKTPYRCPHRLNLSSQSSRSCAGSNIKVLKDKDLEFANSIRSVSRHLLRYLSSMLLDNSVEWLYKCSSYVTVKRCKNDRCVSKSHLLVNAEKMRFWFWRRVCETVRVIDF